MSGRAIRKLQKLQEAKTQEAKSSLINDFDDKDTSPIEKKQGNAFSFLEEAAQVKSDDESSLESTLESTEQTENDSKKKKSKKKKKKKKSSSQNDFNSKIVDEDEIEKAIREVNEKMGILPAQMIEMNEDQNNAILSDRIGKILSVQASLLDWEAEMQRNFGRDAVNAALGPNQTKEHVKRKKKSILVNVKSTWPRSVGLGGLSMEFVDFETKTFSLLHSKAYETLEMMFYQSVATLNPDTLHNILRENNYHLLSLIQLSEVFKQNGDVSNASDFIERALFAFENSIHASFSLTDGSCRLDFDRIESRPVFIALFRHIQYLSRRGCYKTALEFTKMLFSLDPEDDPLATLLFFDFYCLKAEDYSYFIDFYDVFKNGKGLEHLPSFCYSQALSHWELERMGKKKSHSKSSNLLKRAILAHPEVICALFQKLEIKDKFLSHPFFNSPRDRGERGLSSRVVEILVAIFVESSHIFWKVPELLSWLKECCRDALVLVDSGSAVKYEEFSDTQPFNFETNIWIPLSLARALILSDDPNFIKFLPRGAMNGLMTFDPFPPTYAIPSLYDSLRPRSGLRGEKSNESGILDYIQRSLFG